MRNLILLSSPQDSPQNEESGFYEVSSPSPRDEGVGTKHQIPNTKLQRNPGIETPKTKLQTPKKSQVPSSKPRPALRAWNLELGASLVLGAWCLEFGLWCLVFGALIGPLSTDGVPFCA